MLCEGGAVVGGLGEVRDTRGGDEQVPKRLEYVRISPPPVKGGPPIFLAVMVGILPLVFAGLLLIGPSREDPDYVGFIYVVRGVAWAWVFSLWGLIWSVREARRRARAWRDAQVSDDGNEFRGLMEVRRNDQ